MDEAQSEPTRPTDPDMNWTGWALRLLRESAEIDMRCKRMTERQQERAQLDPKAPQDFGLVQARLTRSIRLTMALTERIRTGLMTRRKERTESGEEQRRQDRRERAADMVAAAASRPEEGLDAECMRSTAWEKLVEDEILDAQLDTLSAAELVREVCRKIGYPPDPMRLPESWDDIAGMKPAAPEPETAETEATPPAEPAEAADREPTDDWSVGPGEADTGRPSPEPSKPDSS